MGSNKTFQQKRGRRVVLGESTEYRALRHAIEKAHGDRERAIRNVCRLHGVSKLDALPGAIRAAALALLDAEGPPFSRLRCANWHICPRMLAARESSGLTAQARSWHMLCKSPQTLPASRADPRDWSGRSGFTFPITEVVATLCPKRPHATSNMATHARRAKNFRLN